MNAVAHVAPATIAAWQRFPSQDAAASALADAVAAQLKEAIAVRGVASLVVSGGTTPVPFFHALRSHDVAWGKVTVTLADERWVDVTSNDSNQHLLQQHLLPAGMQFVPLMQDAPTPQAGQPATEKALAAIARPFDAVVLGMGSDGHTASLFPHQEGIAAALDPRSKTLCMAIDNSPKPPAARITLTAAALLNCRQLYLHITGDEKQQVLQKALQPGDAAALPIRAFLHQSQTPLTIYWAA